ncbi:MAG TPA: hypothetical protein VGL56_15035 [Fimbriimonadaceae bacterium]
MRKTFLTVGALCALGYSAVGCSGIGDAPAGPSPAEYQKKLDSMSLDDKIKWINSSPMTPTQKEKMIEDAKAKAGAK